MNEQYEGKDKFIIIIIIIIIITAVLTLFMQ